MIIFVHFYFPFSVHCYIIIYSQQFNFPKKLYSMEYVIRYLKENYNGKNVRQLAKELDYSERWVQAIIHRNNI